MKHIFSILLLISLNSFAMQAPTHKASGLPSNSALITPADLPKLMPILDALKAKTDDWPQLNYYRAANQRFMETEGRPKFVLLGDSIFEYWNNSKLSNFFVIHKEFVNRGISGQTTPQMLLRLRSDVIALWPEYLVLLAGVNDIGANTGPITLEEMQGNLASIAELATQHQIKVIMCSVLPVSDYHFDGKDPRGPQTVKRPLAKIRALNSWIESYAKSKNHRFIDFFKVLVDSDGKLNREYSEDDLHPNQKGYAKMEGLMKNLLAQIADEEQHIRECRSAKY